MEPLLGDHGKEIQEIPEKGVCPAPGLQGDDGVPGGHLQMIVERAIPFVKTGSKCGAKRNECVMLALVWFRSGGNVKLIAPHAGPKCQVCLRAIHNGIKGLAACFEPFKVCGSAPKLREPLSESDRTRYRVSGPVGAGPESPGFKGRGGK